MAIIAYSITAHKNPTQVSRMLKRIYSSGDLFYVNITEADSQRKRDIWRKELKDYNAENVSINFKYKNAYVTFSLVNIVLDAMTEFAHKNYDYFINLSGQCYPLRSSEHIKNFFSGRTVSYMESIKVTDNWPAGVKRYRYSYYALPFFGVVNFALKVTKLKKTSTGRMIYGRNLFIRIPRIHKQLPYGLQPYGDSAWFCLSKKHVDYVLSFIKGKPDLIRYFSHVSTPEENFFQTIIMNSPLRDSVVNENLRYIDWRWRNDQPPPTVLTMDDADSLMKSQKLFARKFDVEIDEKILDFIDSQML